MSNSFKFCLISIYISRLSEMSKFKDTKATKGGNWTEALVFHTGSETHHFSHYRLTEEMSAHEGIDRSEILQKMWLYKRPLTEWQLTQLVCNHQFVVIDSSRWYWSIERDSEKLLLQRNKRLSVVKDYEGGCPRSKPVVEIKHGDCRGTMKGLIEFLHRKEELKNEYDWVINNCKTFANSVFDEFVV